jgi:hypothetical protein
LELTAPAGTFNFAALAVNRASMCHLRRIAQLSLARMPGI